MTRSPLRPIIILLTAVIGVFLSRYVIKDKPVFYPRPLINFESYLFTKVEDLGGFVRKIENLKRLASENDKLKHDQKIILSLKAKIDDLENENDFLRSAAHISDKFERPVVYAGIFNTNLAPMGYNVLLNKGIQDGISEEDIVVTAEGILVGKVQKVMHNFSRVLFASDPEFKITAKVMTSDTSGIARGALSDGMYLDFVVQEDDIKEGDVLISTGNDLFPPSLIIGSVDHVEASATQVFKKVRIRPAIKDSLLGRVLVIKMK